MSPRPRLKKHCLWHQLNPQKPRTLLRLTWQGEGLGSLWWVSPLHTSLGLQQSSYVSLHAGEAGAPHRHRQSADTAPLIKPTCSPVTPAIWANHPPTAVPLAGLPLLTSPCTVNLFTVLKSPPCWDKTSLYSGATCQLTVTRACFGLRLFTSTFHVE